MLTTLLLLPMTAAPAPQQPASGRADTGRELWFDIDADGYEDLLVLTPGAPDRLLRNAGDGTFVDATTESGLGATQSTDAQLQDLDRDGHMDLLLVGPSSARLFRGLAGGQFEEATATSGLAAFSGVQSAAWVDFDKDGLLDLRLRTTAGFQLLRNQGGLGFQSVELGLPAVAAASAPVPTGVIVTSPAVGYGDSANADSSDAQIDGRVSGAATGFFGPDGEGSTSSSNPIAGPGYTASSAGGAASVGAFCSESMKDQATGSCGVMASSDPMLGMLYPMSSDLFVDGATGNVGFGTTNPASPISLDNGLFQVGITQAQVGGGATMELTTEDSSGDQATRMLLRGGNNGDTANIEFYRGGRGAEQLTLTLDGSDGSMAAEGDVRIAGMVEMGSGDRTSTPPGAQFNGNTWNGYDGMVLRRCITNNAALGQVVARNEWLRLERDGTNGGMLIAWDDDAGHSINEQMSVSASWIDGTGSTGSTLETISNSGLEFAGTRQLFTDADDVRFVRVTFTAVWNGRSHTEVSLSRWGNDRVWTGHMITSTNQ